MPRHTHYVNGETVEHVHGYDKMDGANHAVGVPGRGDQGERACESPKPARRTEGSADDQRGPSAGA